MFEIRTPIFPTNPFHAVPQFRQDGSSTFSPNGGEHPWYRWHDMLFCTTCSTDMAQLPDEIDRRTSCNHDVAVVAIRGAFWNLRDCAAVHDCAASTATMRLRVVCFILGAVFILRPVINPK
jgi:hypothetical protein